MRNILYLLFDLLLSVTKLIKPGGSRTIIAENLLLKQQLIIHSRSRQRAPNLTTRDRVVVAFLTSFVNLRRIPRASGLTNLSHAKDSLWSRDAGPIDLFRAEYITLGAH